MVLLPKASPNQRLKRKRTIIETPSPYLRRGARTPVALVVAMVVAVVIVTVTIVMAAATRIRHMVQHKQKDESFLFQYVENNGAPSQLSAKVALDILRCSLAQTNYEEFGISLDRVGLHSIRASSAMALHLNGHETHVIQNLGRWASDAFLSYLQLQVEQFNHNLSKSMLLSATHH